MAHPIPNSDEPDRHNGQGNAKEPNDEATGEAASNELQENIEKPGTQETLTSTRVGCDWNLYPQDAYHVSLGPEGVKGIALWPPLDVKKRNHSFQTKGMRQTAVAVMMTQRWLIPHVLLIVKRDSDGLGRLLSCKYSKEENATEKLEQKFNAIFQSDEQILIGQELASFSCGSDWTQPMPYLPAHVSRPRENARLFQVLLPGTGTFILSTQYTLRSIPITDCATYQLPTVQHLPYMLSRFKFASFQPGNNASET